MTKPKVVVDWHTAKSAARISGLTEDMVNYLCRHKIVEPTGEKSRGRGNVRKYTYGDVLLLRVVSKLLVQGISVLRLKKSFRSLQRRGVDVDLTSKKFVATDGVDIYFGSGNILEQLSSGQMAFAFIIELASVRREIGIKIAQEKVA
ncbi:MerR family transcriptional regulator [Duganella hordei]|uniref:MerR family transcriptional regulator n=1 Tax=Duganella hordei TaxID=2865934 RepID=UPI00334193D8